MMVRFHLDRPYVDFPYLLSLFNYNALVLPEDYEVGSFSKGNIGTEPYILKEYRPEQGATYVKSKDYGSQGKPYMNGTEASYYDNNSPMVLAMQGGELDAQRREELATRAARLQQEETPGIIAYWTEQLCVVKNNVAGLAKGPNIVLDMSPVWTSGLSLGPSATVAGGPQDDSC